MDVLTSLTGSRVRADVLSALFGTKPRTWLPSELGRAVRRSRQTVTYELKRLARAGLILSRVTDGRRSYELDPHEPVVSELTRLIRQTRGRVPRLRHALVALRAPTLAWIVSANADGHARARRHALIVLTGAPRSLVRVQLVNVIDDTTDVQTMSFSEWVTRLEKGDVFLRRARRTRKLWIVGSWEELIRREQITLDARKDLRHAVTNWREELSDEWDEDWDPFAPLPGA